MDDLRRSKRKLRSVDRLLEKQYGNAHPRRPTDPLAALVKTILSQNTSDLNSCRAYDAMREALPTWEDVMTAPQARLAKVLRPGGLAPTKSARIQRILRSIAEDGGQLSLDYLKPLPAHKAEAILLGFDGVGPKTARCVLLFGLGRDAFPIDTHIHRLLKCLGVIPDGMSAEKAHRDVPRLIADGRSYSLHVNLIAHGRRVCRARDPNCPSCVLKRHCRFYGVLRKKQPGPAP